MANAIMNMADLRTQLAAKLQDQRSALPPPTSSRIRAVAKEGFKLPDESILDELEAVVLDVRYINALYIKPFKRGESEIPGCWSVSSDANIMVPDETCTKPRCADCKACPMNEFGSKGNGKSCKNTIRLALVAPDATDKTTPYILDLAPTSTSMFLKVLRGLTVPMQCVVMNFSLDSKVEYPKVNTQLLSPAPDTLAPYLLGLIDAAQPAISRGYDYN